MDVSGNISSDTTWSADTVRVTGDITVDDTVTLTISPGTMVEFQGHYKLDVRGVLLAIGAPEDSITFTIHDNTNFSNMSTGEGGWNGILFDNSSSGANGTMNDNDTSRIMYCKLHYGKDIGTDYNNDGGGAIMLKSFSKVVIAYNNISNNRAEEHGAICCRSSSPRIFHNLISYNVANSLAGGIFCSYSDPDIIQNAIIHNSAKYAGGMYFVYSSPLISSNLIAYNSADGDGGLRTYSGSEPLIINNIIVNNTATSWTGGGVSCIYGNRPKIIQNIICNNVAYRQGAGLFIDNSNPEVSNNVISNNACTQNMAGRGSAIAAWGTEADFYNNIIWGNDTDYEAEIHFDAEWVSPNFYNNIIAGGLAAMDTVGTYTGTYLNNLDSDPEFIDPSSGVGVQVDALIARWHIAESSPCINAGIENLAGLNIPAEDYDGKSRVSGAKIDMGIYEFQELSVCGAITQDTEWPEAVIKVNCNITIPDTVTLTIAPGATIEFQDNYTITVEGRILAQGTEGNMITFTASIPATGWGGIIIDNSDAGANGAMDENDSLIFEYCHFEHAKSSTSGGALHVNFFDRVRISHCMFKNNETDATGGAIFLSNSDVLIEHSTLRDNNAVTAGGGMYVTQCDPLVVDNLFYSNSAVNFCGGIMMTNSNGQLYNNRFCNNLGFVGVALMDGNPTLVNNIITNHYQGLYFSKSRAKIINNTISRNNFGLFLGGNSDPTFINCIIYGNDTQVNLNDYESNPDFFYCNIEGGTANFALNPYVVYEGTFENNIDGDPQFSSPSAGIGTGYVAYSSVWTIPETSPCINAGNKDYYDPDFPACDYYDSLRVSHTQIDIGAFEFYQEKKNVCGLYSSTTGWYADTVLVNCDVDIADGTTITINPGTVVKFTAPYQINVEGTLLARGTKDKMILFTPADTNGFSNDSTAEGGWAGIKFDNTSSGANGAMYDNDTSIFEYCKFEYGKAFGSSHDESGGAIRIMKFSRITMSNSTFTHNKSKTYGGAIYIVDASYPVIRNCSISHNKSVIWNGGGLYISHSGPIIEDNIIEDNLGLWGGGIYLEYGEGILRRNLIRNNSSEFGGGVYLSNTDETNKFDNNIIVNNKASERGGGIVYTSSNIPSINNTIAMNKAKYGGGIRFRYNSDPLIQNNIIWGNVADTSGHQINLQMDDSDPSFYWSLIEGGVADFGLDTLVIFEGAYQNNLDTLPGFISLPDSAGIVADSEKADWSLDMFSPCINAGSAEALPYTLPNTDISGNPRFNYTIIDLGAMENQDGLPVFTRDPENKISCEGQHIVLSVSTSDTCRLQWQMDRSNLPGKTGTQLIFDSITFAHEGLYRCLASNAYGEVASYEVSILLKTPPKVLIQPDDMYVKNHDETRLDIIAEGTSPLSYQWIKDDQNIDGATLPVFIIDNTGYLDEGRYRCVVQNSCGYASTEESFLYLAPELCMVTVSTISGDNLVIWERSSSAPLLAYNIYRESKAAGIYDLLATIPYDSLSVFVDSTADPTVQAYLYRITAIDTALYETDIDLCEPHKTIHLLVSTNPELNSTQLEWDNYYGFDYQTYYIYRSTDGSSFDPVYSLSASFNSWTDTEGITGELSYRVAVERPEPCYPDGGGKKAGAGPYHHALSNLDNNRLKEGHYPPDSIWLDNLTIAENNVIGALVGRVHTHDPDSLDNHTYSLVSGEGDDDNAYFTMLSDLLIAAAIFDYETDSSYSIRIRTLDQTGNYLEHIFIIKIIDIDESVGIPELPNWGIGVSPNPFSEVTNILFSNSKGEDYTLYVYDLSGKLVRTRNDIRTNQIEFYQRDLPPGIYTIELRGPGLFRTKMVIE